MAGIGGGVIIKPLFDMVALNDITSISVLSASTVFAMSSMSLIMMFISKKLQVRWKVASLLAFSSIIGGFIGKALFNTFLHYVETPNFVALFQSFTLAFLMILIYVYQKIKHTLHIFHLDKSIIIICIGFSLGVIAAFLGIGGGPFNVAILSLFFSMNAKEASINSLFIIFFSQLSSIVTTSVTTGFEAMDLSMLPFIVIGGVLGGVIGSSFLTYVSNRIIDKIFSIVIFMIIIINIYNGLILIPAII